MKFSKLDLLTLLISLFLFSSCKDSSSIGLDVSPATEIKGTLLDTATVMTRTVLDDPTTTYPSSAATGGSTGLIRYPLGQMTDPIFGSTIASMAMSVTLPGATGYVFGKNAVIDSAVLVLPYQITAATAASTAAGVSLFSPFYGDSTTAFNFTVSQLNTPLTTQTPYLSNVSYASTDVLGTLVASSKPTTAFKVRAIVTGGPDTLISVVPQIRIKLSSSMIQSKIIALDSATLSTNSGLMNAFKGLKVTAATATGKPGGMMYINLNGASSNLEIYYKRQNATTATVIDTVVAKFPIITTSSPMAATVAHDYTGKPIATQLKTPGYYPVTYLQAMSGVRNKITFPYLKNLKASLGTKLVINKAELVVDISDPADSIPFKIPPRLSLYRLDIAQQRQNVPDNNPPSQANPSGDPRAILPFGGFYDKTKKSYTFVITSYIQDLIDGKTVDNGTYLGITPASEFNLQSFATSGGRAVIASPPESRAADKDASTKRVRLNIYYVKSPNN
ncbi:DUF4270 domain-containing protein [Pedobacter sp. PAMC26386]|nr:DUF4270 domain-containing protein [Pedobacter sp. PAMC26386]